MMFFKEQRLKSLEEKFEKLIDEQKEEKEMLYQENKKIRILEHQNDRLKYQLKKLDNLVSGAYSKDTIRVIKFFRKKYDFNIHFIDLDNIYFTDSYGYRRLYKMMEILVTDPGVITGKAYKWSCGADRWGKDIRPNEYLKGESLPILKASYGRADLELIKDLPSDTNCWVNEYLYFRDSDRPKRKIKKLPSYEKFKKQIKDKGLRIGRDI